MKQPSLSRGISRCLFCVAALALFVFPGPAAAAPLDDYLAAPDASYSFSLINTFPGAGYTTRIYDLTSQSWRDGTEMDRIDWEHWLIVVEPDTVTHETALMWIDGGSNGGSAPSGPKSELAAIATATQSMAAQIRQVPNQPIHFTGETVPEYVTDGRYEDELLAWCWDQYRQTGDPEWVPRLPMVKSVVRAMDTVQAEYPSLAGFVVGGVSKRGWTTWITGAADPRVEAIIPVSIDVVNVENSMRHHHDVYGYWADAVGDYVEMGVMNWIHTPAFRDLMAIADPYSYLDRLAMPKYIVNSAGDEFFLPDSSRFYSKALKGESFLRYTPNTNHGQNAEAWQNIAAFYNTILDRTSRPEFSWTIQPDGAIHVKTVTPPSEVRLWQAANTSARNFRRDTIGAAWTSTVLTDQGGGSYVAEVPEPAEGWTAFFVELTWPGTPSPFKATTDVSVVPQAVPFREPAGWGAIETVGEEEDAVTQVHVGGGRYEMGYWYGRLLADQIAASWDNMSQYVSADPAFSEAAFDSAIDAMWKPDYFDTVSWELELRGIADGCFDAGYPEITFRALQKFHVLPDMSEYNCGLYAL
jgi:PhoPQ-activated pathogenicity-related protein